MKFAVCIKQVPDVAATARLDGGRIVQDTERMVLNAYDASALEECLVLREAHGGEVEVVLIGPERASETIRKALAMGADEATHIVVDQNARFDSLANATILAGHFRQADYDIIACGKQAQDTDAGLTGGMLAALLDLPYATNAVALELEPDALVVTRQGDSGREIIGLPFPCLVTCSNDMNDPRIPSLKGIMQSKKKTIRQVTLEGLEVSEEVERRLGVAVQVTGYKNPPGRPPGELFEGEPSEVVTELMARL